MCLLSCSSSESPMNTSAPSGPSTSSLEQKIPEVQVVPPKLDRQILRHSSCSTEAPEKLSNGAASRLNSSEHLLSDKSSCDPMVFPAGEHQPCSQSHFLSLFQLCQNLKGFQCLTTSSPPPASSEFPPQWRDQPRYGGCFPEN